ncbi:hypothetical protein BHYA_0012g00560 [Botrytis hyacinthi]|uniref:Uncharacterized protein n=1 Tax=Botrytis hyacinthi TaxID=278943 RepID=A0A4Z1H529_9HELO|nr:hypothetical protein BHYA_0012g00560 [Botrytis hyacinthi]
MAVKPLSEQIDLAQASLNFALSCGGIGIATDIITLYISVMLLCTSLKLVTSLILSAIALSVGRQESHERSERSEPTLIPIWILAVFIATTTGIMFSAITLASNLVRCSLKFGAITGTYGIATTTVVLLIMLDSALHHWHRSHPEEDEDAHETNSELDGDADPPRPIPDLGYECYQMLNRVLNFRSMKSGCIVWGIRATLTQVYIDLVVGLAAEKIGGNPNPKAGFMTWLFWLYFGFQVLPLLSC